MQGLFFRRSGKGAAPAGARANQTGFSLIESVVVTGLTVAFMAFLVGMMGDALADAGRVVTKTRQVYDMAGGIPACASDRARKPSNRAAERRVCLAAARQRALWE